MPNIMPRLLAAILALLAGVSAEAAAAAEVNVLCSGAMRGVLQRSLQISRNPRAITW